MCIFINHGCVCPFIALGIHRELVLYVRMRMFSSIFVSLLAVAATGALCCICVRLHAICCIAYAV